MPTGSTHNDKRASRRALPLLVSLVVGIAIGAAASWPLLFALDRQAPVVDEILRLMLPAFGVAAVLLLIAVPIAWWALSRFIKATGGTLQDVVREARQGVQAAANNDTAAAASHAEQAILEGLAWYGPLAARRFVVRTALGLLIAFGGMIGTALLFRQTVLLGVQNTLISEQVVLLSSQNAKIDLQTVTAEAQRRGVLSVELFSIMQEVAREIENVAKEQARPPYRLSRGLTARIVTFSGTATPYWLIEMAVVQEQGKRVASPRLGDALDRDHLGRTLPSWRGCRIVGDHEVFFMNWQSENSFDGRYFGPLPATTIVGRADPLWTKQKN